MPTKIDKVIVTNFSALKEKYGKEGLNKIDKAVADLIKADEARGLITSYLGLDDTAAMKKLGAKAVKSATNRKQNKAAIDGVYKALAPDYIMLMGAIDVIPHQDLKNPMFSDDPDGDPDRRAFGDIPYACEAPYNQQPRKFIGPTRVVGRLPDITGATDPAYLIGLLKTATNYKATTPDEYQSYFGISAEVWTAATKQSLERIFGNSDSMNIVPPKKDNWPKLSLGRKVLFVNCHGNSNTPIFSGQSVEDEDDFPDALRASFVDGKITEGTLAAIECCYGGQLYNPKFADGQAGICNIYLGNKAYGYFGSTTIAYGPSSGSGQADLICQYFLRSVLGGASIGRAALEARQRFARTTAMGNPMNIKTIAQFNLYGDPSVSPVKMVDPKRGPAPKTPVKGVKASTVDRVDRSSRRRALFVEGKAIVETTPTSREVKKPLSKSIRKALTSKAKELGVPGGTTKSFKVESPGKVKGMPKVMADGEMLPSGYHVLLHRTDSKNVDGTNLGPSNSKSKMSKANGKKSTRSEEAPAPFVKIVALVAKEVGGKVVSVTKVFSK